jgi:hypothetical protein
MTPLKACVATAAFSALALAAPASAQIASPEASQIQDLTYCAGAIAALHGLNLLQPQNNPPGEWSTVLGAVLARLNREPGVEGMTGRVAADDARLYWREQSRARQERQANQCRSRFGAG